MTLTLEVASDLDGLAGAAADRMVAAAGAAVEARGVFTLAVSGGGTPLAMFDEIARRPLPWDRIHIFQVDERVVPPGDPDRNLGGLIAHLLDKVPVPSRNVHPLPVDEHNLSAAAGAYGAEIRVVTGPGGVLDLVHLGLGDDGHTASWPPGDPVADETLMDVAVVGPYRGHLRMTLTPAAVNRARHILWLVDGEAKAPVLRRLLDGDPTIPATRVRRTGAVVLAGAEAAPGPS